MTSTLAPASTALAELVHAEAERQLDQQAQTIDNLHTRATGLLAAAGIIGSLFGIHLADHHSGWRLAAIAVAIAAFAAMTGCVIAIQWPRKFAFGERTTQWQDEIEAGTSLGPRDYHATMGRHLANHYRTNADKISAMFRLFAYACAALGVQVVCLALTLL